MNKFCFTQSESNKSYCKTQEQYYIHSFTDFLKLCQYLQLTLTIWGTVLSNYHLSNVHVKSTLAFMSVSGSTSNSKILFLTSSEWDLGMPEGQAGQESSYLHDIVERSKGQFSPVVTCTSSLPSTPPHWVGNKNQNKPFPPILYMSLLYQEILLCII